MGRLIDLFVTVMGTESGGERIEADFTKVVFFILSKYSKFHR